MRKKLASAASSALRRSFSRSAEQTAEIRYAAASTARDSLVASTSGRTTEEALVVAARRRPTSSTSSTFAPRVSSAFARQLHQSTAPAQGALPESAPRPLPAEDHPPSSSPEPPATPPPHRRHLLDPELSAAASSDPFSLVAPEVEALSQRLRECVVSTAVPVLSTAAEYFFRAGAAGKRLRPTLVLLMAGATAPPPSQSSPSLPPPTAEDAAVDTRPPSSPAPTPRRRAQRLAEIAELIHVASLLHDDVIDDATLRRGLAAVNAVLGNKVSVLAGDFLLARASVSLASLRDHRVTELMSRVIEDLVAGEVAQMSAGGDDLVSLESYERRCFLKTASLMSRSSQAAALLAGASEASAELAARFGESLGLAFQVTDDALDYDAASSAALLGKPAAADAKAGVVTAPALLPMLSPSSNLTDSDRRRLEELVRRRFKRKGDPEEAARLVRLGDGCELARELAAKHADAAVAALKELPPPAHEHGAACRVALESLARAVVQRKK